MEFFFAKASHDVLFTGDTAVGTLEDRMRAGVFQALKWTMQFCEVQGRGRANLNPRGMHRLVKIGESYETLVDIMTSAQADAVAIDLEPKKRLLTVHQGPDLTGFDDELVEHQRLTNPYHSQASFVYDDDQLTRRWSADDFRRLARRLASSPQVQGCDKICLKNGDELFTRPTVLEFPNVLDGEAEQRVLEDMTLAPAMIAGPDRGREKWLDFYFQHKPTTISKTHAKVVDLSNILNQLPIHTDRPDRVRFRNPNGVYMKLCNFLAIDPTYYGKGLERRGRLEQQIRTEFHNDPLELRRLVVS